MTFRFMTITPSFLTLRITSPAGRLFSLPSLAAGTFTSSSASFREKFHVSMKKTNRNSRMSTIRRDLEGDAFRMNVHSKIHDTSTLSAWMPAGGSSRRRAEESEELGAGGLQFRN